MKRWELIDPARFRDSRGELSVLDLQGGLPFGPKRVFWITDVPAGESRGFHAHRSGQQLLVCLSGSITARVLDGQNEEKFELTVDGPALWMKNLVWGEQTFNEDGSTLLVLASNSFEEADYIRDYESFLELCKKSG